MLLFRIPQSGLGSDGSWCSRHTSLVWARKQQAQFDVRKFSSTKYESHRRPSWTTPWPYLSHLFLYHYSLFRLCFSRWIEHFWKRNKDLAHLVTSCTKAAVTRSSRYPAVLHTSLAKKFFVKRTAREAEKYAVGHLLVSTLTKFQGSAMILASKKKDLSTGRSNWAPSDGCLQAP